ncbi:bifunctional metallophosphatase/5'-nucleotidase [Fervidibacillus halotolerans]|uniref:5'-nucleotidase C-terminal domain-containing protein n=1 Tax=Fervidibacillus halotolerans TaxID=2980027 RepID=A0A9E8RYC5_9BACI|nr:5'-nucleotidase C-terminal domain-containing protein [Fervidibacillus halotolerans]WAA12093.1 5'-nucleotidase C-terminal domain-containing protein [Fervidibacillus halotolerans]
MKFLKNRLLIAVSLLVLLVNYSLPFGQVSFAAETDGNTFDLTIMHVNDTHAHVEQFPFLSTAVEQIRAEKPNNLLLHAGDVFSGTLYFTVHKGLADVDFMNKIGFDAMVFGNHEFDKDSETLGNFVNKAEFPLVGANIDFTGDSILGKYVESTIGQPGEGGKIYPAIVKEVDGESIGIIGLITEETPSISSPGENILFHNAIEKATQTVKQLEEMGIDKIIALTHLGYKADVEVAKAVDGIDVIVGGHSHTELPEGTLIEKDEPTVIVQTGDNLNNLGVLDVTFDENGVVTEYSTALLALEEKSDENPEGYDADEELSDLVKLYYKDVESLQKQVVGETTVVLDGERANVRTKETNLGNLIADGMVWNMQQIKPEVTIALQNGGGIRASVDKGEITLGEVLTVMPFGNMLVYMELTGDEIWQTLEHSVSKYPETNGGFLHVSGLKFTFDPEKPAGERIVSIDVKNTEGKYEPINKEATYYVATNSFTAKGGDGYDVLAKATEEGRMVNVDMPDYEVFTAYLNHLGGTVSPSVEGRIVALGVDDQPADDTEEPADQNDSEKPGDSSDDQTSSEDEGKTLPNTATDHGNILFIGLSLIVVGFVVFLYYRKQRKFI